MRAGTAGRNFGMEDSKIHATIWQVIVWCGVSQKGSLNRSGRWESKWVWEQRAKQLNASKLSWVNQFYFFSCHMCDGLNCPACSRHSSAEEIQTFEDCMGRTCKSWDQPWGKPTRSSVKLWSHKIKWQTAENCGKYEYILQSKLFLGRQQLENETNIMCLSCNGNCSDLLSVCVQSL